MGKKWGENGEFSENIEINETIANKGFTWNYGSKKYPKCFFSENGEFWLAKINVHPYQKQIGCHPIHIPGI